MDDRSGGASALLGMAGFVVLSAAEAGDELWLLVETGPGRGLPGLRGSGRRSRAE